jgi:hypothetical protein
MALTCGFSVELPVELPGLEPVALPGKLRSERQFRSVSIGFSRDLICQATNRPYRDRPPDGTVAGESPGAGLC